GTRDAPPEVGSALQQARHEPDHEALRRVGAGIRNRDARRPAIGTYLPNARKCLPAWEQVRGRLTYGADTDWVRNVIAAGGCGLETRGRTVRLTDPRLFTDPTRSEVPAFARWALGLMRVDDLLELRVRR